MPRAPYLNRPAPGTPLSRRERELLTLVAAGWSNAQIAAHLYLSIHTVKTTLARAYRRLGAHGRANGCALAIARNYIDPTSAPRPPHTRPRAHT
jgi:DNA-binding CsgD family transcriptional regulator